jgi:hypothetical protein
MVVLLTIRFGISTEVVTLFYLMKNVLSTSQKKRVYSNKGQLINQPSTSVSLWLIILCFTSPGELLFHDSLYIQCAIDHNVCILMVLVELS